MQNKCGKGCWDINEKGNDLDRIEALQAFVLEDKDCELFSSVTDSYDKAMR